MWNSQGATIAFAIVLALAAVLSSLAARRAPGKAFVDMAAAASVLLSLAVSVAGSSAAHAASMVAIAFVPAALGLAAQTAVVTAPSRLFAGTVAGFALLAGGLSAATAVPLIALLIHAAGVIALVMLGAVRIWTNGREGVLLVTSALALACAGSVLLVGAAPAAMLFLAAALVGVAAAAPASHAPVEQKRWSRRNLAVRGKR